MKSASNRRWFAVAIFFIFMLLHQSDKLLIGPLTTPIMNTFGINEVQMGVVFSGAIVIEAIFYPLWGYFYDRFTRSKLLSLAAFIWGATTWLSAIASTFPIFVITRASTGIDDSSYPGLYSLVADYFPPKVRGKIYGLLQLTMPIGYLMGMLLALLLGGVIGWRAVFYLTGSLGILVSIAIFFVVQEAPRGGSEPELADLSQFGKYHFEWKIARGLFRKPSLILILIQGFFGSFPWQVITFWFFRYLEVERGYSSNEIMMTMVVAVLALAAGYPLAGALGDYLFKRTPRGRLIVAASGVLIGAALMFITLQIPIDQKIPFMVMLSINALFIPFASPNVLSTVYDITLPEVRSTANALQNFAEQGGSAVAPTIAGIIAVNSSLKDAILLICVSAWLICFVFFLGVIKYIPRDIQNLRMQLQERAAYEQARQAGQALEERKTTTHPEETFVVAD
ncbi:MAG: MFS transporter [Chloroflexi bacterium]|nr:MFS transporter [Chloroflexota bacterium]